MDRNSSSSPTYNLEIRRGEREEPYQNTMKDLDYNAIDKEIRPQDLRKNNREKKRLEVKPLKKAYILLKSQR